MTEGFAAVVNDDGCFVVAGTDSFLWNTDSGFIINLSCIALTLATSAGPLTNILLVNQTRLVVDHIFVIPCGTSPFHFGPTRRYVPLPIAKPNESKQQYLEQNISDC
jgi:hypothetical protein